MGHKSRAIQAWLLSLLILWPGVAPAEPTAEAIIESWSANERISPFQCVCQVENSGHVVNAIRGSIGHLPDDEAKEIINVTFSVDGEKVALSESRYQSNHALPTVKHVAFNGQETRTLFWINDRPHATIERGVKPPSIIYNYAVTCPILIATFPMRHLKEAGEFSIESLKVENSHIEFDGKNCILLSMSHNLQPAEPKPPHVRARVRQLLITVDPALNHRIVRLESLVDGATHREFELSYAPLANSAVAPQSWWSAMHMRNIVALESDGKILEWRTNTDLTPATFDLTFPQGTQVSVTPGALVP